MHDVTTFREAVLLGEYNLQLSNHRMVWLGRERSSISKCLGTKRESVGRESKNGPRGRIDYKEVVRAARDQVRTAKAQTELNLTGNRKRSKNFFSDKKKAREDVRPLWKENGDLVLRDTGAFCSVVSPWGPSFLRMHPSALVCNPQHAAGG